jgi:cyclopropane fatty-acyl-phospholipid synthase-like methyltransferase
MRTPGSRTFRNLSAKTQDGLFSLLAMERVIDRRERRERTIAMGFDGQWDEHQRFQMDFLRRNGLRGVTRFLEIGFGPLTLAIPLIRELDAGGYTGVDVREGVANLAYRILAKEGLAGKNPRLLVSDRFGAESLGDATFDILWSFSVLYHLEDALVAKWFGEVSRRLAPDGRYWANINVTEEESRWLQFPFLRRKPEFYADLAAQNGLQMQVLGSLADLGFRDQGAERLNLMLGFSRS